MSNVVPVLVWLAGRQSPMTAPHAVSVVSIIAYSGILLEPAIIAAFASLARR